MADSATTALITDETTLFCFLAALLAGIFWLSERPAFAKFFTILPAVIWAYFVPMICTTLGIIPSANPVYSWISKYLLPLSLFLLMIAIDLPAILKLGRTAIIMMLAGTLGIVIGGPIAYLMFGSLLPPDAWKGFATLAGSWIGGSANMIAIQQSVGAPDSALGPIIVVDTVVGYGWMGVLIFLSSFQKKFDTWVKADMSVVNRINEKLEQAKDKQRPFTITELVLMVGMAFGATALAVETSYLMPELGNPTIISRVVGGYGRPALIFYTCSKAGRCWSIARRLRGPIPAPCFHRRTCGYSGRARRPHLPARRCGLDADTHCYSDDCRASCPCPVVHCGYGQHGQCGRSGKRSYRGGRLPPGDGSRGSADGRQRLHPWHLRSTRMRMGARPTFYSLWILAIPLPPQIL